jgi:hypothetical protein
MERNKWETAIRCLEIALHPNTGDDEIVAAANGFRRIARGTPLSELYTEMAASGDRSVVDLDAARWQAKFERANQENFELRLQVKFEEQSRALADRRLRRADREIDELRDRLAVAHDRIGTLEEQLDAMRERLRPSRAAAKSDARQPTSLSNVMPFRTVLDAAKQRDGHWEPDTAPAAARSRAPWTA